MLLSPVAGPVLPTKPITSDVRAVWDTDPPEINVEMPQHMASGMVGVTRRGEH